METTFQPGELAGAETSKTQSLGEMKLQNAKAPEDFPLQSAGEAMSQVLEKPSSLVRARGQDSLPSSKLARCPYCPAAKGNGKAALTLTASPRAPVVRRGEVPGVSSPPFHVAQEIPSRASSRGRGVWPVILLWRNELPLLVLPREDAAARRGSSVPSASPCVPLPTPEAIPEAEVIKG